MRLISYRNTAMAKLAVWFGAAGILVVIATPALVNGSLAPDARPAFGGVCALAALLFIGLWRARIHALADQVLDCGEYLEVRRGQIRENIPFATILGVTGTSFAHFGRLTIRLVAPTRLGTEIDFMPHAHLWSNPVEINRFAAALTARANRARTGDA
jgi:hypothetical protein